MSDFEVRFELQELMEAIDGEMFGVAVSGVANRWSVTSHDAHTRDASTAEEAIHRHILFLLRTDSRQRFVAERLERQGT